jgi:membrane protein YqaA with SNARE-associated domain
VHPPERAAGILDRLEAFATTRQALIFVALWGLAEAIVLPIVPDVALYLLALAAPGRATRLFLAAIVGALAGSAILAGLAFVSPESARSLMLAIPAVEPQMLQAAQTAFGRGEWSAFVGVGPGTPLKVDTVAWVLAGGSALPLAIGVVVNRLTRIGPGVLVTALLGAIAPGVLRRHERPVLALYAGFWVVTYAIYWS